MTTARKSALAQAIEKRGRPTEFVQLGSLFRIGDRAVPEVAVRVNVKDEEDDAIVRAHRYVEQRANDADGAKGDHEILDDAKARFALWHAFREIETDAQGNKTVTQYPAFPSPDWMAQHLGTDEIAILWNLYQEHRARVGGWLKPGSEEELTNALAVCAEAAVNPIPGAAIAHLPREQVVNLLILAAARSMRLSAEMEVAKFPLEQRIAELEAEVAALKGSVGA